MATNISKYVALSDFLLLEYEFNRDAVTTTLSSPIVYTTNLGTKELIEGAAALSITNNVLSLNSIPLNSGRTSWLNTPDSSMTVVNPYFDSSVSISTTSYALDSIKVHIVSGYNFDDVGGFLLQVRALDISTNFVDLINFTYAKQSDIISGNVIKFSPNTLFLGNKFYDKYIEFSIPSIQSLSNDTTPSPALGGELNIISGSDVYITYSTIFDIINDQYILDEQINVQLPVTSAADNFNCFIAESTTGDYIEYYALWNSSIIGDYMGDIESGKIKLYTSNNPNDNFEDFSNSYGSNARKWVIIHEITVYEHIPGGTSLITQKYSFTQDQSFSQPNYFRPILKNADIDSSYSIQYVCRLTNRMDGTQIIRKASFSSLNPKKYGLKFTRINVDNIIPYKVFNRIEAEKPNIITPIGKENTKYIKIYYDTTTVLLNYKNEVYPQGTGPLFLKSNDSIYKFKFEKTDVNENRINVDLSGVYNYKLVFTLDDDTTISVGPTYSTNMNTYIGELEFKLNKNQLSVLKVQTNNNYSIMVEYPNGNTYTFYEGKYYSINDEITVINNYASLFTNNDLIKQIAELEAQINELTSENAALKTK